VAGCIEVHDGYVWKVDRGRWTIGVTCCDAD